MAGSSCKELSYFVEVCPHDLESVYGGRGGVRCFGENELFQVPGLGSVAAVKK